MAYWCGLDVKMLGTFELTFEGSPIHLSMKQSAKPVQLFQLLLSAGETGVSRQRIIDALFSNESEADATNSLNVAVSRLRKLLRESLIPNERYIVVRFDHYFFEAPFPLTVDTREVESLRQAADLAKGSDRISLLYQVCDMYQGRFLPDLDGENWVEILRAHYQRIFSVSLSELCTNCQSRHAWNELSRLVSFGANLFPYDGWDEWPVHEIPVVSGKDHLSAQSISIGELYNERIADTPLFIVGEHGVDLVVLTRQQFDELAQNNAGNNTAIDDLG